MKDVVLAKFSMSPQLKMKLLHTGNKVLREASNDQFWGVGWPQKLPNIWDKEKWTGKNTLSKVLQEVRDQIRV